MSARDDRLGAASGRSGKKLLIIVAVTFVVLAAIVFAVVLLVSGDRSDPSVRTNGLITAWTSTPGLLEVLR
ncbi:hypothetical protein FDO65_12985 [Nakamurella flava]|uniref:Uncharacterized protein n=1 Tax=Nakamurella flava TaxID=2576308 RepID=A0A4U6QER8_9ACTN|nr:hypothetical protein [Nakamurella flava]TKV58469.1 hypothetical protein FDO65_12985 [Nakamurella flava]